MNTPLKKNLVFLVALIGSTFIVFRPIKVFVDSEATYTLYASETTSEIPQVQETTPAMSSRDKIVEMILEAWGGRDNHEAWKALTIASCESGLNPDVINSWGDPDNIARGEHSVGIFQINLRSNAGQGIKVHWDKVPGTTLEEKEAWLKVPANNIKVAKKIYDAQGWNPWSTYMGDCYKVRLGI